MKEQATRIVEPLKWLGKVSMMMIEPGPKSVLVCGLPGSGKTTYLAALWHLLQSGEMETALALQSLAYGEYEYVNTIRRRWQQGKKQIRTVGAARQVGLDLESNDGRSGRLMFLDHSGETFDHIWELRSCSQVVAEQLRDRGGVALFVRAEGVKAPVPLSDLLEIEREMREAMPELENERVQEAHTEREWSGADSPDQVKIVDLLQILAGEMRAGSEERLAVIVSAWDRLSEYSSPEDFVARRLPLLAQYLQARIHPFEYRYFGVSAQGCEYVEEDHREALPDELVAILALEQPSLRLSLLDGSKMRRDLTLPVDWLIGGSLQLD